MSLAQMALWGSVLILCILAVRVLALRQLPKTAFLVLWEIAALRLLLPVAIPVPVGLLPLPALPSQPLAGIVSPEQTDFLVNWEAAQPGENLLCLIWGLGTAVLGGCFLWAYIKNRRVLQAGLPFHAQEGADWLTAHPICRPLELRVSDQIGSPLTYGILHPVILLPKGMPSEALDMVLTHEYVHVRRFDALVKLLFAAALSLHWWNPLVWAMYVLADRDMELSCDAAVLRLLGGERRKDYAMTLLHLEERRRVKAPSCNYFSENLMKERIESIMRFKKTTAAALTAAAVLTIGATAVFAAEEKTPTFDALKDTESPLPYGQKLELEDFQTMEQEDGSILYAPKGVDLEKAEGEVGMKVMTTYTVSSDHNGVKGDVISLTDLPGEHVEPTEEYDLNKLVSVKHSDQSKFTPEEWADILEKIDNGEIVWED